MLILIEGQKLKKKKYSEDNDFVPWPAPSRNRPVPTLSNTAPFVSLGRFKRT